MPDQSVHDTIAMECFSTWQTVKQIDGETTAMQVANNRPATPAQDNHKAYWTMLSHHVDTPQPVSASVDWAAHFNTRQSIAMSFSVQIC